MLYFCSLWGLGRGWVWWVQVDGKGNWIWVRKSKWMNGRGKWRAPTSLLYPIPSSFTTTALLAGCVVHPNVHFLFIIPHSYLCYIIALRYTHVISWNLRPLINFVASTFMFFFQTTRIQLELLRMRLNI